MSLCTCLLIKPTAYTQMHSQTTFIMSASSMNIDQTAPEEQSDLGPYYLQYKVSKYIGTHVQ